MSWIIQKEMLKQKVAKYNQLQVQELAQKTNRAIKHSDTKTKTIADFPLVQSYIDDLFPSVGLSDINIYIVNPKVMDRNGFDCAGCYIPQSRVILVKSKIVLGGEHNPRSKFGKLMQAAITAQVSTEDVVVHELIHAVSDKIRRSGRKYNYGEEEFVYTNCVDFYRSKGQSYEEIICGTFLPFCVNDVLRDSQAMRQIWDSCGIKASIYDTDNQAVFKRTVTKNAESLSRAIVQTAKDRAQKMIELYNKYGRQMVYSSIPDASASVRMRTVDMDCDF